MSQENGILIIAESTQSGDLKPITGELFAAASGLSESLGEPISVALIGQGVSGKAQDAINLGASKVYVIDNPIFQNYLNETYTEAVISIASKANPRIILMGHTPNGRELGPSVAVRLETGIATDTSGLSISDGKLEATRSLTGGLFRQKTGFPKFPNIATVHMKAYDVPEPSAGLNGEVIEVTVDIDANNLRSKFVNHSEAVSEGIKIEDAKIIICGGRGMGGKEEFDTLYDLTEVIAESAVAATRAAADSEFCGQDLMIGITGKVVSPEVYFAIALSGASQHMAGCSGSKNIIAINKDPEANIFKESKYGVIGDYKDVVPAFLDELKKLEG